MEIMLAIIAWTLTVSPYDTPMELSITASKLARQNLIEKGNCIRFDFESIEQTISLCRTENGHPYFCYTAWNVHDLELCEQFNER